MQGKQTKRVIISGGGTGGHIFPAIAIANALKRMAPDTEILFVGATGRMEMEKVPAAGYDIIGLEIQGINRQSFWKNWNLPWKLWKSFRKSNRILKDFKPDVVVGVGGYASGPLLMAARRAGIPYLIQEQNSFAGVTNKKLGSGAEKISVAFDGMERFFPAERLMLTGNPIRLEAVNIAGKRDEGFAFFGLDPLKKTILLTGGSLGARTLNEVMVQDYSRLVKENVQLIWQCGNYYYDELKSIQAVGVRVYPFVKEMDLAYAVADVIISRAGAGTIAELCAVGKPVVLVPSPNVAEDHQTKNAQSLVRQDAAIMVRDVDAKRDLVSEVLALLQDKDKMGSLGERISTLAKVNADRVIAEEVLKIAGAEVKSTDFPPTHVYFIGIGGIGMSGLARYFKHLGCEVAGYDRVETQLTQALVSEGISVIYEDNYHAINPAFKQCSPDRLVVYTPAVPKELGLLKQFREAGHDLLKRSQVLGIISEGRFTIAVAGTHGKTTTSSMVAHILTDSGYGCSAFLGGIATNYNTNTLFGENNTLVVEADEYDRSFLTLHPDIAIVTSADADHLDIYGDHSQMQESFQAFLSQVSPKGSRIVYQGLPFEADVYYSVEGAGQAYAEEIHIKNGSYYFNYVSDGHRLDEIEMGIPGKHNIANAVAAITVALELGIAHEKIKAAVASFAGVKRRFEYIVRDEAHIYIDDYAHHPTELRACLSAVRELYPEKKMTIVFQPHLYSRTRDFMAEFAAELAVADTLLLMEIYPARELPIPGIDSTALLAITKHEDKYLVSPSEVLDYVKQQRPELLVTLGAGNIDQLVNQLKEVIKNG